MESIVDVDALEADRAAAIEAAKSEAVQEATSKTTATAEQEKFFTEATLEGRLLAANKDFEFLKDADDPRARYYNEQFALAIGYQVLPVYDENNRPVLDEKGQPKVREYASNPTISYEKFVREMKKREDELVEARLAEKNENIEKISDKAGIKPGGEPVKTTRIPKLEDVHKISDDEWEKVGPLVEQAYGVKKPS